MSSVQDQVPEVNLHRGNTRVRFSDSGGLIVGVLQPLVSDLLEPGALFSRERDRLSSVGGDRGWALGLTDVSFHGGEAGGSILRTMPTRPGRSQFPHVGNFTEPTGAPARAGGSSHVGISRS